MKAILQAGVGLHFSSLPGAHGIGDIADGALSFVDILKETKLAVWQFLPTGPTAFGNSPYQALSAFAGNEMLIGLDPLIRQGLLSSSDTERLNSLAPGQVDFGHLIPVKQALLQLAASRFATAASDLTIARDEFLHRHESKWLNDYALYRVLKTRHLEQPWPQWDKPFVHRDPDALRRVLNSERKTIEQIKVIQFFYHHQWRALRKYARQAGIRLFGDMPVYIALDSADAWAHPELLLIDGEGQPSEVAGVPPDYFSADGQLWGNPLYDWAFHAGDGYQWWIHRMQHAVEMCDLVRIDHFRGFESFWSVPFGSETARHGAWESGPGDALFKAMKAALGELPVVAEDLGLITPEVVALRQRHKIPGMKVLQFGLDDPLFKLTDVNSDCVCYTGTHDNDTTIGWFRGGDDDVRTAEEMAATRRRALAATGGSEETIHLDLIKLAFSSKAMLAVAPMQDYLGLGSEARMNTPGTTQDNWRWRLLPGQLDSTKLESVRELVLASSRA